VREEEFLCRGKKWGGVGRLGMGSGRVTQRKREKTRTAFLKAEKKQWRTWVGGGAR